MLAIDEDVISINKGWADRIDRYEELARVMSRVNAPGNDVMSSGNADKESDVLAKELANFNRIMIELRAEAVTIADRSQQITVTTDLDALQASMKEMVTEALPIFEHIRRKRLGHAMTHNANMDRAYADLQKRMAEIRGHLGDFQELDLRKEKEKADGIGSYEYIFAAAILLIVALVTVYGFTMSRRIQRAQKMIIRQRAIMQSNAKMAALGEMAGGIAHEINTPLATIQLSSELIREGVDQAAVDRGYVKDKTVVIDGTVTRIAKIIRGLRTFARDGKGDPFKVELVGVIVDDTLAFCREKLKNQQIQLDVIGVQPLQSLECRSTQIAQVLMNLISNAADAVHDVANPWIKIQVAEVGELMEISVTDNGPGIPEDIQDKVMQPFFTTKDVGKGTGLGLSISKGIVESHNGRLFLDAESPKTRFVIQLPKLQPRSAAEKTAA